MKTLTRSVLADIVRTHLDEVGVNESMMLDGSDDVMLDELIWRVAGECADEIHSSAPVQLLDGVNAKGSDGSVNLDPDVSLEGSVLEFDVDNCLRLVSFRASDSSYVVTDVVSESSPEGRKQLNPYVCGAYDSPVLVLLQGSNDAASRFRYYSLSDESLESLDSDSSESVDYSDFIDELEVIPRQLDLNPSSVVVSDNVLLNYYYLVSARVLALMGESTKSEYYYGKAKFE